MSTFEYKAIVINKSEEKEIPISSLRLGWNYLGAKYGISEPCWILTEERNEIKISLENVKFKKYDNNRS